MGRPKTINVTLAEFLVTCMQRFRKKAEDDPTWVPNESQAKVIKMLAETQVIIQRRKPEESDDELVIDGDRGALYAELERDANMKPSAEAEEDGDG